GRALGLAERDAEESEAREIAARHDAALCLRESAGEEHPVLGARAGSVAHREAREAVHRLPADAARMSRDERAELVRDLRQPPEDEVQHDALRPVLADRVRELEAATGRERALHEVARFVEAAL